MRGRAWRRARADVYAARVFRYKHQDLSHSYAFQRMLMSLHRGYQISYSKRNSIDEVVTVLVETESQYQEYIRHLARKMRDTRSPCSCHGCGNPRGQGIGNNRGSYTTKEAISGQKFVEDVCQSEHQPLYMTWRSKKWRAR